MPTPFLDAPTTDYTSHHHSPWGARWNCISEGWPAVAQARGCAISTGPYCSNKTVPLELFARGGNTFPDLVPRSRRQFPQANR